MWEPPCQSFFPFYLVYFFSLPRYEAWAPIEVGVAKAMGMRLGQDWLTWHWSGFKGVINSGSAYGRLYLVGGIDMQFSHCFPACSEGNPRSGLPDQMRALFLHMDLATWTLVREGVRRQWPAGAPSTYEKHQMSPLVFARGSKRHMPSSFGNVILLYVVEVGENANVRSHRCKFLVCMLSGVAQVPNCVPCGLPCQCLVCLMVL
jgi:hypothetical protein